MRDTQRGDDMYGMSTPPPNFKDRAADLPAAGWYPNPKGQGWRFYDGRVWTSKTSSTPGPTQEGAVAFGFKAAVGAWAFFFLVLPLATIFLFLVMVFVLA